MDQDAFFIKAFSHAKRLQSVHWVMSKPKCWWSNSTLSGRRRRPGNGSARELWLIIHQHTKLICELIAEITISNGNLRDHDWMLSSGQDLEVSMASTGNLLFHYASGSSFNLLSWRKYVDWRHLSRSRCVTQCTRRSQTSNDFVEHSRSFDPKIGIIKLLFAVNCPRFMSYNCHNFWISDKTRVSFRPAGWFVIFLRKQLDQEGKKALEQSAFHVLRSN